MYNDLSRVHVIFVTVRVRGRQMSTGAHWHGIFSSAISYTTCGNSTIHENSTEPLQFDVCTRPVCTFPFRCPQIKSSNHSTVVYKRSPPWNHSIILPYKPLTNHVASQIQSRYAVTHFQASANVQQRASTRRYMWVATGSTASRINRYTSRFWRRATPLPVDGSYRNWMCANHKMSESGYGIVGPRNTKFVSSFLRSV